MMRNLILSLAALLTGTVHAEWVQLADAMSFDKPPPIWCNAQRSACIISWQNNGPTGAVRVALIVEGSPDCQHRRPRYVYVRKNGTRDGDLRTVHAMQGQACIFDIPMDEIEGTQLLRFSVPMLTRDSVLLELSLEGFNADRLTKNRS